MITIPEECMPIIEIIRKEVPKPEVPFSLQKTLRISWKRRDGYVCLLGLLPGALSSRPHDAEYAGLPKELTAHIEAAYKWFDEFTMKDAKEVIDAIWPDERTNE